MSGPGGDAAEVDARGLRCPAPVLRAAAAARTLPAGALLRVTATDPAAAVDLPAWARMRGHELVTCEGTGDLVVVTVRLTG
ncbi:sulfurtransferase TusA family protein [Cellulomonas sp. JZ18]|uniref:sulfurtransferase TusA family protein n=1 Tax=Cellulomonas sp. JZ18 TaxID=2654191 RepID=UPI0012D42514|nr:sulfurtransferase TusA family protein [Cellulomonas sp. JZ18]QGQ19113.1 sulfurtransferase TusA family protein [Cellulomonas sp. JZ18]